MHRFLHLYDRFPMSSIILIWFQVLWGQSFTIDLSSIVNVLDGSVLDATGCSKEDNFIAMNDINAVSPARNVPRSHITTLPCPRIVLLKIEVTLFLPVLTCPKSSLNYSPRCLHPSLVMQVFTSLEILRRGW